MSRTESAISSGDHRRADDGDFFAVQARHVRQCLREGWMAVAVWLVGMAWCCTVMILHGYVAPGERPVEPELVWGMPSWVFWGLFVPWIVQILATWWFALCWMKDDEPYQEFPTDLQSAVSPGS